MALVPRAAWLAAGDALARRLRADERALGRFSETFDDVIAQLHRANKRKPPPASDTVERIVTRITKAKS